MTPPSLTTIPCTKMHGIGNDFVVLDAVATPALATLPDLPGLARRMCDRHSAVGADGLIVVMRATGTDGRFGMRIINSDGSDGGMCGNGARCIAKLLVDMNHAIPDDAGRVCVRLGGRDLDIVVRLGPNGTVQESTIDMGEPVLGLDQIPVRAAALQPIDGRPHEHRLGDRAFTFVNMGNPHAVCFEPRLPDADQLQREGQSIETHDAFPERTNVQFARVVSSQAVQVRTWERGAGATRGCGSGACAVVVAGVLTGRLERDATVAMPGGDLRIRWDASTNRVLMTGPAEKCFTGEWLEPIDIDAIAATGPALETPRLILRQHRLSDAEAMYHTSKLFEIARFTETIPHPYPRGAERRFMEKVARLVVDGRGGIFAIVPKGTDTVIGGVGVQRDRSNPTIAEIGYHLDKAHWGNGYATEAVRAVVDHAFGTMGLQRVHARWLVGNEGSGRVLEKAGFTREGQLRRHATRWGEVFDVVWVGMLREQWEQARAPGR